MHPQLFFILQRPRLPSHLPANKDKSRAQQPTNPPLESLPFPCTFPFFNSQPAAPSRPSRSAARTTSGPGLALRICGKGSVELQRN